MDHTRLAHWMALANTPGLGLMGAHNLINKLGSIEAIFDLSSKDWLKLTGLSYEYTDHLHCASEQLPETTADWLNEPGNTCLTFGDKDYPALLREIADPPLILFVKGNTGILNSDIIAMVGSRHPTPEGKELAHMFAFELSRVGLTVASGLALGIDGKAHEGSLAAGGSTVAVMGTGADVIYPRQHTKLAEQIRLNGATVTEFAPGTPPLKQNFPQRNRIISGLALGVVVIEAASRSGSLITARLAGEQGREVFSLPGPIGSPLSRGCHQLIRQGAKLTENIRDILEEIQIFPSGLRPETEDKKDSRPYREQGLLKHFGHTPVSMDTLVNRSGLTPDRISSMLLQMELSGEIVFGPDGLYRKSRHSQGTT